MTPITPRVTRLVRVANLRSFRHAAVALACDGPPLHARDRLVLVPTRAAASQLVQSIERQRLAGDGAVVLPVLATARELVMHLAERLPPERPVLLDVEREVLLSAACRDAVASGHEPPFRLRPALVAEMLEFYDALRSHQKDVAAFERLALGRLEPGADIDRGADRLVRQTRFLAAAFAEFERRTAAYGMDEHGLRQRLRAEASARPIRHVIVTVADRAFDRYGLCAADWDLLTRVPGLERLDVIATDGLLAGAFHERIHTVLPALEETRFETAAAAAPVLLVPPGGALVHTARDREEEIAGFARRARRAVRIGQASPDRVAMVVEHPLPYVYLARETFRAGRLPCQMLDALPLAAEPYAAALDAVMAAVAANFTRPTAIALLRSPHFQFRAGDQDVGPADVAALDRALGGAGYLGQVESLETLVGTWQAETSPDRLVLDALSAGVAVVALARELVPLRSPAPAAAHLTVLVDFLVRHASQPGAGDAASARQRRARSAVLATLVGLREAYARFDQTPASFDDVAAIVTRRIETHTFAPRTGERGVHVVDAEGARFGDFDEVQLAGLVDGEWPERARRSIFYSQDVLRDLGWPSDADRRDAARARFVDLLRLPSAVLVVSTFSLEGDTIVSPSTLVETIESAALETAEEPPLGARMFEHEALGLDPVCLDALEPFARASGRRRVEAVEAGDPRRARAPGSTAPHRAPPYAVSALERYQDCPFLFFAADVLRLEDERQEESGVSPREHGRLVHDVVRRFFEAWDARGGGPITPVRLGEARALFADMAEPLLARLGSADAAIERMRLFGSAIALGAGDIVLGLEATRPTQVRERWLERRFEGAFSIGPGGAPVILTGVADRIDLLPDRRLRVVDYKSGAAPDARRALQVPTYALCAQEELERRDGRPWTVEEAAYVTLAGGRTLVPVFAGGADGRDALDAARARLHRAISGIEHGEFPPRPHDTVLCRTCAYSTVCRKEYVRDE